MRKGLRKSTRHSYKFSIRCFLGFLKSLNGEVIPSLYSAWDKDLVEQYFDKMKTLIDAPSICIAHNALENTRHYMKQHGWKPSNHDDLTDMFKMWGHAARKERTEAVALRKFLSKKEVGVLKKLYLYGYHSDEEWTAFNDAVEAVRTAPEGEIPTFSASDMARFNAFMILLLTIPNIKRAGNISRLEAEELYNAVNRAFNEFKRLYPNANVTHAERRLDRSSIVAAVASIPISTKTLKREDFVILRPRDQRALVQYHR